MTRPDRHEVMIFGDQDIGDSELSLAGDDAIMADWRPYLVNKKPSSAYASLLTNNIGALVVLAEDLSLDQSEATTESVSQLMQNTFIHIRIPVALVTKEQLKLPKNTANKLITFGDLEAGRQDISPLTIWLRGLVIYDTDYSTPDEPHKAIIAPGHTRRSKVKAQA